MKQFTVKFETLTPTFMSGENQQEFDLRPPSFKGLLRFWWRAYFWGHRAASENMPKEEIQELMKLMKKKEGVIFGTSDNGGQKSHVSLRIIPPKAEETFAQFPKRKNAGQFQQVNVLEYLAYGTYDYQRGQGNQFIRPYLPPQSEFSLILTINEITEKERTIANGFEPDETIEQNVLMSVYLLATCGAVGAKSRNGFGSLHIKQVLERQADGTDRPYVLPCPQPSFAETAFFNSQIMNTAIPNFTAFSKGMRLFKLKQSYGTWDECLWELGDVYKNCKGKLDEPLRCEKRQYLASPITIQQRIGGRWQTHDFSFLERRSKPYFLRVIKNAQNKFDGYILYLSSEYCPGLERDRNKQPLNEKKHSEMNRTFQETCQTFNQLLLADSRISPIPLWTSQ